ncbi:MAG: glycosyltransferase [Hyphomonadaceae bacterium]|nr:glycosyltransferase [Hyphomonadaceae bacterium]
MGDGPPRVSVIMANFNGGAFIAAAVRSVIRQSEGSLELIVADDGSSDDSLDRAEAAAAGDPRLTVIRGGGRTGPAATRNRAIGAARGDWVAIVDNDDFIHPGRLHRLLDAADADGADIVADDLLTFYQDIDKAPHAHLRGPYAERPQWISAAEYQHSDRLFRSGYAFGYLKPVFRRGLGIRYDERLRIGEDSELVLRLLIAGARMRTYPDLGYFYRKHSGSISHRLSRDAIAALDAAHSELKPGEDPALAREMASARDARADAAAFTDIVNALKARDILSALRVAARRPSCLHLLRRPVGAYLTPPRRRVAKRDGPAILMLSRHTSEGGELAAALRAAGQSVTCIGPIDETSRSARLLVAARAAPGTTLVICDDNALIELAPYACAPEAEALVVKNYNDPNGFAALQHSLRAGAAQAPP